MKFWLIVNRLITNLKISTKLNIASIRGRERESILGTSELKKLLKIDIFVSLCERAGKQKILWIVKNYILSVGKE